jgi:hypothetical protein
MSLIDHVAYSAVCVILQTTPQHIILAKGPGVKGGYAQLDSAPRRLTAESLVASSRNPTQRWCAKINPPASAG